MRPDRRLPKRTPSEFRAHGARLLKEWSANLAGRAEGEPYTRPGNSVTECVDWLIARDMRMTPDEANDWLRYAPRSRVKGCPSDPPASLERHVAVYLAVRRMALESSTDMAEALGWTDEARDRHTLLVCREILNLVRRRYVLGQSPAQLVPRRLNTVLWQYGALRHEAGRVIEWRLEAIEEMVGRVALDDSVAWTDPGPAKVLA